MPMSAAIMADPESLKNHLVNGSSSTYFPSECQSFGQRFSEPPSLSLQSDLLPSAPLLSKDDTYTVIYHEGNDKSPPKTLDSTHALRPHFDPRQLLDPKGYNSLHRKKETGSFVDVAKSSLHTPTLDFADDSQKRNRNEGEEYGMGNMIERVHHITERQEGPRKKQKTDKDDDGDDTLKARFSGGGKGGEIGEYMKQKREEGQKDSEPFKPVIDLTEGETCPDFGHAM